MLSIYVQELSRAHPALDPPENAPPNDLRKWAGKLTPIRPDMERAVQSLGRINPADDDARTAFNPKNIDLRRCNLQGFDLNGLNFQGANLSEAKMQGADLSKAEMQGANLSGAEMQGAYLSGAEMDTSTLAQINVHDDWDEIFHPDETRDYNDFITQWRAFAASLDPPVTIRPDYAP